MNSTAIGPESLEEEQIWTETHTHRGKTGRRWPSTSQVERSGTNPSLMAHRKNQLRQDPDLRQPAPRSVRKSISVIQIPQPVGLCCGSPSRLIRWSRDYCVLGGHQASEEAIQRIKEW